MSKTPHELTTERGEGGFIFNFFPSPIAFDILVSVPSEANNRGRNCSEMIGNWRARCDNYPKVSGLVARVDF